MKIVDVEKLRSISKKNTQTGFSFTPKYHNNMLITDITNFYTFDYENNGEKVGGSKLGNEYEILTFQIEDGIKIVSVERFSAILIEPIEYIIRLMQANVFGFVGLKTTTSDIFFDDMEETLRVDEA